MLGLYVHIPFCKSICGYCDFKKRVPKNEEMINEYLNHLKQEFEKLDYKFDTIFIGGGTPSMLNIDQLKYLLDIFKNENPIEYTIECNPESLNLEKIELLSKYKVNRISLGVQTFSDRLIKFIGRHHSKKMVFEVVEMLKKYFNNINIDMMYSIPGQKFDEIKEDLNIFKELNVNHISYYSLILEENTPFYIKYMKNELKLNDIDLELEEYKYIINYLKNIGFKHYEISNFSRNFESIHNKLYWQYDSWIGIGLSAASKINNRRYQNSNKFNDYYNNILEEDYYLDNIDRLKENIIMSLRLIDGFNINYINNLYNVDIFKLFNINDLINKGLLEVKNGYLRLTENGLYLGNEVFESFI